MPEESTSAEHPSREPGLAPAPDSLWGNGCPVAPGARPESELAGGEGARLDGQRERSAGGGAPPEGAITVERAKALEAIFLRRFEEAIAEIQRVPHPVDRQLLPAGPRERIHLKRSRSEAVIDLMKRHRVYDRALLDTMPLEATSEVRIYTKGIFGRKEIRVVIAAIAVSPLEDFVTKRFSLARSGVREIERAIESLPLLAQAPGARPAPRKVDSVFHYVGVFSTVGWERGAELHLPNSKELLACLVENRGGTAWAVRRTEDERWAGLTRLFDPETDREKIDRTKAFLATHRELAVRGGHVLLKDLHEEAGVSPDIVEAAVRELLCDDAELSLQDVGGRRILKRRRL